MKSKHQVPEEKQRPDGPLNSAAEAIHCLAIEQQADGWQGWLGGGGGGGLPDTCRTEAAGLLLLATVQS